VRSGRAAARRGARLRRRTREGTASAHDR